MSSSKILDFQARASGVQTPTAVQSPRYPSNSPSVSFKSRTSHACDRCRLMRTKCSGGDRCVKCTKDDTACQYGDRKRERNKKDLAECYERIDILEGENQILLSALRTVANSTSFGESDNQDIMEMLSKYSAQEQVDGVPASSSPSYNRITASTKVSNRSADQQWPSSTGVVDGNVRAQQQGERRAASSVGSPGHQGELTTVVDLDAGKGASGFVGKMSEMAWIQRVWEHSLESTHRPPDVLRAEIDHQLTAAKDFNYFMDDTDVLEINEDHIDEQKCPPLETAVILSEAYFHSLQGAFQFVRRETFLGLLTSFPHSSTNLSWNHRCWLALANIVWAIGSKWLQMSKLDHIYPVDSHLTYYARARRLGLDHRIVADHPDVERVQAIGVLAFYLLINGSIARAWNTLGQAIRHATALGLHLRVTDASMNENERDRRARTWYSLFSLEVLIAEITGRPKSISVLDVTVNISIFQTSDQAFSESSREGSNRFVSVAGSREIWLSFLNRDRDIPQVMTGGVIPWKSFASVGQNPSVSHFPQRLLLCRLSDKIAVQLYSGTIDDSWAEIQRKIGELQTELRQWAENLPDELSIQSKSPADSDPRVKIELSMYYHSVQMILHRPCLCEIIIDNESPRSQEFNRSCARACVHAAMSMIAVMPDNPSAYEAYQLLPFWALLHYVAQAAVVLLLELSLGSQHFKEETPELVNYLRKAMTYIYCLTDSSLSAYRAWRIFRRLLAEISERYENNLNIVDIPEEAPRPVGWDEDEEERINKAFH